ncbi:hypothetical protein A8139_00820 [Marinomonas primoryensis]|uniref:Uncharacterized protein n=1 Tax=Marinomonas primoryensis TaxID=178399 RepID=A0A2Z4PMG0_9GAMM|nr:hypothetical protein [Marinomonas primoryensis]AWX98695.1 hypothetical protein A8139_00820 [Marinomonas primoryensis]
MAKKKLTKGQIEGIRLVADIFMIRDLDKNVMKNDKNLAKHSEDLMKHLEKEVPILFVAEAELKKQYGEVRKYWLEKLLQCKD